MSTELICDGCGQAADPAHITRRLKRLENMTRYRPIHVHTLFLGAMSPMTDAEHLYSAESEFRGEGQALVQALGIEAAGKSVETVLTDFQRRGLLFVHLSDCPSESDNLKATRELLEARFTVTAARIRRSLKPKKLALIGEALDAFAEGLKAELPGVEIVQPEKGRSFRLNELGAGALASALSAAAAASL